MNERQCSSFRRQLLRPLQRSITARAIFLFFTLLLLLGLARMQSTFEYEHIVSWLSYGAVNAPAPASRYAIATFLTENSSTEQDEDGYFIATRLLTYQLLHANETRIRDPSIDWLVMVTDTVTDENRQQLEIDGAIVVPVKDIRLSSWIKTSVRRWKDQFTKLRLLQMTQYARVLFIDADSLLTRPMDGIFDELASQDRAPIIRDKRRRDEMPYPDNYVFLARPDNGQRQGYDHAVAPDPLDRADFFNAGFWLAAPSHELFSLLMRVTTLKDRFDPSMMEQSMLNYVFRRDGPMPWGELDWRWNANFPNERDRAAGVYSLHDKFWQEGQPELRSLYGRWRERMESDIGK